MTASEIRRFNRRQLIRTLGAGALAVPFLRTLPARAQVFPRRSRFLMVTNAQGTVYPMWSPTGTRHDFQLSPILQPLERHKKDLVIIEGLTMASFNHPQGGSAAHGGFMHLLVGRPSTPRNAPRTSQTAGGRSLDQDLADHLCKGLPVRALHTGVSCTGIGNYTTVSYRASGDPNPVRDRPDEIYQDLFGKLVVNDTPADPRSSKMQARIRGSVVDFVHREFGGMRGRLGISERRQLDSDLQNLSEIEKSFRAVSAAGSRCQKPDLTGADALGDVLRTGDLQLRIIAQAFACDLTRVATLSLGDANSEYRLAGVKMSDNYHEIAHRTWFHTKPGAKEAADELAGVDTWFHARFAEFLDRFKAIPSDGGTLLDDSLILFANALGHGGSHSADKVPFLLAGRAGGKVKTGQYLNYPNLVTWTQPRVALASQPTGVRCHNDLLTTIGQAMGLPMQSYGLEALNGGPLTEVFG